MGLKMVCRVDMPIQELFMGMLNIHCREPEWYGLHLKDLYCALLEDNSVEPSSKSILEVRECSFSYGSYTFKELKRGTEVGIYVDRDTISIHEIKSFKKKIFSVVDEESIVGDILIKVEEE